jgi:4-alpha-glucanotransferase
VAHTAIVPLQDVLGLGRDARMNVPGLAEGNWSWRVRGEAFNAATAQGLRGLVALYDRLG